MYAQQPLGEKRPRCILHIDLDAFYAQVEMSKRPFLRGKAVCVQQHDHVIAVSYEARELGASRRLSAAQIIETVGHSRFYPHDAPLDTYTEKILRDDAKGIVHLCQVAMMHGKVSLELYRQSSREIMKILENLAGSHGAPSVMEKASIDEVYIDVTNEANRIVQAFRYLKDANVPMKEVYGHATDGFEDMLQMPLSFGDCVLISGAIIANTMRQAIFSKLGYTCSAGIGHNKMLAKLGSSQHKPNGQCIIFERCVERLMYSIPLRKVPLLGGKVGAFLRDELSVSTREEFETWMAANTESFRNTLVNGLGTATTDWLLLRVKGIDSAEVVKRGPVKSLMSSLSFPSTRNLAVVRKKLESCCVEMSMRVMKDRDLYDRWPKSLTLRYRSAGQSISRVYRDEIPDFKSEEELARWMCKEGMPMIEIVLNDASVTMNNIGLHINSFRDKTVSSKHSITALFSRQSATYPSVDRSETLVAEKDADGESAPVDATAVSAPVEKVEKPSRLVSFFAAQSAKDEPSTAPADVTRRVDHAQRSMPAGTAGNDGRCGSDVDENVFRMLPQAIQEEYKAMWRANGSVPAFLQSPPRKRKLTIDAIFARKPSKK